MIIDSHQHFWKYDSIKHSWIDESMTTLKRDFLPNDLKLLYKKNNINGCVAVQSEQSENETSFLLNLAKKHNYIKGVVGWVDLNDENIENRLEYFIEDKKFKGIRHIIQSEPEGFMLQDSFLNGMSKLEKFNLPYDILINRNQMPETIELIKKFPNHIFILNHIAKPQISGGLDATWLRYINEIASYENVFCKLSGMVTETKDFEWKKEDFSPFIESVIKAFGVHRVMYGSDWPVCLLAASYESQFNIVLDFISQFSLNEKNLILGENSKKAYNL